MSNFRGLITEIIFGADQLFIWCVPIVWLVLTDFKLVLTDLPAGRNRFFSRSLLIHNANIANNLETMYKYLHIFIKSSRF
jgi:recombinational DNA repair ATPase RecF